MNKLAKIAATAALAVGLSVGVAPTAAQADVNTVCHKGTWSQPPLTVLESGGAKYKLYPGQCTSPNVSIFGFRPVNADSLVYYKRNGGAQKVAMYKPLQWTGTLGDITVTRTMYLLSE